ncbi:FecCD family ABC transporter permease [Sulfurospirillum arsenophilum]|uniref:FecCD family ABC transporter permease n=1 Tax=Sulfurospirillum arsenophilum TaxID=56698 RepID=UPI000A5C78ED|nr:iron ABC transporter permease [Sulfurospirillum arsenophilum]
MKNSLLFGLIITILVASSLISLALGRYEINPNTLMQLLLWKALNIGTAPHDVMLLSNIIFDIRLPRILAVVLVGAALSVSGGAFQAMFVNPLVSPGILGVLAGASFGAALGIMISKNWLGVQLFAFLFGFVAVLVALGVAKIYGRNGSQTILLVLGGVISSSLFSALLSVVKFVADPYNKLPTIVYWLMGSFSSVDMKMVASVALPLLVSTVVLSPSWANTSMS